MAELEAEIDELEQLVKLAKHNEKHVPETKLRGAAGGRLPSTCPGGRSGCWSSPNTRTRSTSSCGKLTDLGFYCCTIHGGMLLEKRIDAEREFFEHKPSIMVATEAAGEGINLQFCSLMVNYDIPWNPNRLEQRMGRIHRYKQEHEVMIFNLVAKNTREGEVMDCLLRKLEDMRKALGSDRVYDVIGEIMPAPKFDSLMKDWLAKRRTMTEILADIDLQTDEKQVARIRADIQDKALGSRYIDLIEARCRPAEEQGAAAHAGIHREVLRGSVPLLRRHHHDRQGPQRRLVDQPGAARPAKVARGAGAALRQNRPDLPTRHLRQGSHGRATRT